MVINPTSTVKLFSGIPLDNTYTDTLYFATPSDQLAWLNSLVPVKTFTSQMYQRVNSGVFEANCKADDIYNCNYMAFQNSGFGTKWFFAFITSVEYINNNNSRVSFEIDVMQTWFFDVELERCFIERQHSVTDNIGDNILPEPVALGEYVFDGYDKIASVLDDWVIAVSYATVDQNNPVNGKMYDNVYGGSTIVVYPTTSTAIANLNEQLQSFIVRPEAILMIYMLPVRATGYGINDIDENGSELDASFNGADLGVLKTAISGNETFGNYLPRNKKLYTYPYNYFHVDDGDSGSLSLRYEFFNNLAPHFTIQCTVNAPVQIKLLPVNYKGTSNNNPLLTESITITGLPIGSWNYDTYRAWQAQSGIPSLVGVATGTGSAGAMASYGKENFGLTNVLGSVANAAMQWYQASLLADTCRGNYASANVNFSHNQSKFYSARCHVTEDYARMIDSFFDMYGYTYNKLGIPNRSSRPHWNYVKTIGCKILGQCPCDDLNKMCSIYDAGITFWKHGNEVGNYTYDNSPE